ncbi:MAG: response regulator transcription factor [Actinomycetota bacterium]|jgi:two-component system KDP operon response regulator KdpE|nr:response regulator transcription factor [Actinomycetota bacterium]
MARILVVDDDRALLRALEIALGSRGHEVVVARTAAQGISQLSLTSPDVVILDLGLPDMDGVEVVRRARQWTQVPVIVLSAAASEARKVTLLDAGADDYMTKPFGMAELEARLRVALRHHAHGADEVPAVCVGGLEVDLVHHMARLDGKDLELTAREFDLLAYLARHVGKVCTHQMILREVWGSAYGAEAHYLRVYAHRLRRKLGPAGTMLRTQPGIGYQLVDEPS